MTAVRLALAGPPGVIRRSLQRTEGLGPPSLLVSYAYRTLWRQVRSDIAFSEWVLDSGAFSAHNSGWDVTYHEFLVYCRKALRSPDPPVEIFALDEIGNPEVSLRNAVRMRDAGVQCIPTFHQGSPWDCLRSIDAEGFDKIALGGLVGTRVDALRGWLEECFARLWPRKLHGFGVTSRQILLRFPFHSVDATSWEIGPTAFGNWNRYGSWSVRGGSQDVRVEIQHYLALEKRVQARWKRQFEQLGWR